MAGASVWITHIMTLFTFIVSTASKPLRGRLNHYVTTMVNQVMMTVIHTASPGAVSPRDWSLSGGQVSTIMNIDKQDRECTCHRPVGTRGG